MIRSLTFMPSWRAKPGRRAPDRHWSPGPGSVSKNKINPPRPLSADPPIAKEASQTGRQSVFLIACLLCTLPRKHIGAQIRSIERQIANIWPTGGMEGQTEYPSRQHPVLVIDSYPAPGD